MHNNLKKIIEMKNKLGFILVVFLFFNIVKGQNLRFDYNFVKDSIVIDKKMLLEKLFGSSFENDSTVVRKEFVIFINGKEKGGEIEYKTSVLKEYYYIDDRDDEERVNVILLSKYNGKNAFLETITFAILNNGKSYRSITNDRLNISSGKYNHTIFKTIKGNGKTYFTIEYSGKDNHRKIDYYSALNLKYSYTKEKINKVVDTNTNLSFLKEYDGKYPYDVELLSNTILKKRIIDLIGIQKYNYMNTTWSVEGSIIVENNMFDASGCEQHNCDMTNFIIVVDLEKDILYIGYRVENEIFTFGEDQNYPKSILDWEKENINRQ